MNLHVSLVRARPLHSPSWPLSERVVGVLLARRPAHSREGLGGRPVSLPSSPHPSWGSWQTWKGPETGQVGMSRKVRWESAQWSPGHKPCFILPPKGRRAPRQTGCLLLQRSPSASSRAGLGLRKQRTHTLSGRPLWVNIRSPLAPGCSESHGGCGGRSIGWIQSWSEKALGHRGPWQAPVCVQAMLGAGQTHLWVRWSRCPALHSCPSFQVLSGLDLRQQPG